MPFPDLVDRLGEVQRRIGDAAARGGHGQRVRVVAVTKTHGVEAVEAAFEAGLRDVGENKVQEAIEKMSGAPLELRWHLIGHLQRNKARFLPRFQMLHSLDSPRLADAVSAVGSHHGSPLEVLVQVNVAGEETKGGYEPGVIGQEGERLLGLTGLRVVGVMTMAPFGASEGVLRSVFSGARSARDMLAGLGHPAVELSMGMSDDYEIAVEEGATMLRLGTVLFGARST
jgi:PLP dependent protein